MASLGSFTFTWYPTVGTDQEKDEGFTSLWQNHLEEDMQQQSGMIFQLGREKTTCLSALGPGGREARAGGCTAWQRRWSPSSVDTRMSAAVLPTRRQTAHHLPLNLSPIGAHDKVSYKHKDMVHAMAIDKHKALYWSDKPILATWASNITYILLLLHSEYWNTQG
jgi:hypothetical protein